MQHAADSPQKKKCGNKTCIASRADGWGHDDDADDDDDDVARTPDAAPGRHWAQVPWCPHKKRVQAPMRGVGGTLVYEPPPPPVYLYIIICRGAPEGFWGYAKRKEFGLQIMQNPLSHGAHDAPSSLGFSGPQHDDDDDAVERISGGRSEEG